MGIGWLPQNNRNEVRCQQMSKTLQTQALAEHKGPAAFPLPVIPTDTSSGLPRQRHEHPEK
jgi:hypothetical protein